MPASSVADAGPLIAFARALLFHLLHAVFEELLIPDAVYQEVVHAGDARPGAEDVAGATWIRVVSLSDRGALSALPPALGPGECEAILLAKERSLPLLADDRAARTEAQRQGVAVSGSVGVLLEAKRRRTIPAVRPALDQLRAAGYRLSEREYERGLRRAGEWP